MELGIRSADENEVREMLGRRKPVGSGLVIPYPDPRTGSPLMVGNNGDMREFTRVRLDSPERARDRNGSPSKYLSRRGSGQQPYVLPSVAAEIENGLHELILVEGEKKTIKAVLEGFPAIGLAGNWGWKAKDKQELLPLLASYLRANMVVTVVWDSDAALNTGFAASTRMLHDVLRARDCQMRVVVLPQAGIEKVGLDDYIVQHGVDAFRQELASGMQLPADRQVGAGELIASWADKIGPAIGTDKNTAESVLHRAFRKGLVDRIDHASRLGVIGGLQHLTDVDVAALFEDAVTDHLANSYPKNVLCPPPSNVASGDRITVKDSGAREVVEVRSNYVWATGVRNKSVAMPIPGGVIEKVEKKSRKPSPAELADEFLERFRTGNGETTLRSFRLQFHRWNGSFYEEIPDADMRAEVMGFLRAKAPRAALPSVAKAVVENLRARGVCHLPSSATPPFWVDGEGVRPASSVISFVNGNLDLEALRAGERDGVIFTDPTPGLFLTTGRGFEFDADATCPQWSAFIEKVLPDPEIRSLAQELMGYCLIPNTSMQRFFLLYGPGANGKGVFSDVLANVVGLRNVSAVSLARFAERFALWPLTTKLVNLVAEMPAPESRAYRLAEDKLKAIVSGDLIEVERKNKDVVAARPTARLVFSCNELPAIVDRSNGVWRRLVILPFGVVIPEKAQDADLAKKIIEVELPGVMNWAIDGLMRLLDRGRFQEPTACKQLKADHRLSCFPEEEFLLDHCRAGGPSDFMPIGEVYNAFRTHVGAAGNRYPVGQRRFAEALMRLFPSARRDKHGGVRGYWGVTFDADGDSAGGDL